MDEDDEIPRFHPNWMHLATGPFDLTITWSEHDPTVVPEGQVGQRAPTVRPVAKTVLSYGAAKAPRFAASAVHRDLRGKVRGDSFAGVRRGF